MSNAEFNIPATLTFIDKLERFYGCLEEEKLKIERSIKELAAQWKDPKFNEFNDEFAQHFKDLEELKVALKTYHDYVLKDLLPDMEEYLKNTIQ